MKTLEFYKKNVYGAEMIYIKDKEIAQTIQTLTNKKTVNQYDINCFKKLGFNFVQVIA